MIIKIRAVLATIFILALVCVPSASAQQSLLAGSLDPTFSEDGKLSVGDLTPNFSSEYRVKVQPDGKLVTLSAIIDQAEISRLLLHRFNSDGSLDTSFAIDGNTESHFDNCCALSGMLLIQPTGKIVVVADSDDHQPPVMLRYNLNGTLDTSFDAPSDIKPAGYYTMLTSAIPLSSGKMLLIGSTTTASSPPGFLRHGIALVQLNANGTLDTSFGSNGKVIDLFRESDPIDPYQMGYPYDAAVQADGKIVATGQGGSIRRYSSNGSLEDIFAPPNVNGCSVCWRTVHTLSIQTDGKMVAAGSYYAQSDPINSYFYLVRYNPGGAPDTTFDNDGQVWTDLGNDYSDFISDLTLQSDGKIVVGGSSGGGYAIARYNQNGSLDGTFGENGAVITSEDGEMTIHAIDLTADDKLVVIGSTRNAPGTLARYLLSDSQVDPLELTYLWLPLVYRR